MTQLIEEGKGPLAERVSNGLYFNSDGNNSNDWPNSLLYTALSNDTFTFSYFLAKVLSKGTVRLRSSDPGDAPRIDPAYLSDNTDYKSFVEGVRFAFFILEKSLIAQYVTPPSFDEIGCPTCPNKTRSDCIEGIVCYIRYYTSSGSHPCCTTPIGSIENSDAVVDPFLRVKNINNLRVCDSSVFPDMPSGNLNSPTTMVAEKCSQIIIDYHRL